MDRSSSRLVASTVGVLSGVASAGLSSAVLGVLAGRLTPAVSAAALGAGLVVGLLAARSVSRRLGSSPISDPAGTASALALAVFGVVSLRQFLGVSFESGPHVLTLLPNNYGDMPLHWTYVSYFARGSAFWPDNPIAAGERLRYPLGVDLLTALGAQLGAGVPLLFRLMGVVGAALAAHALYLWGRGFAVAAFLFSGGWLGLRLVPGAGLMEPASALAWKNLFLTLFVPQRGFLFALPAGLVLLWSWRKRLLRDEPSLPAWVEGLLWGALPLFHLHTFLFVSAVAALWALATRRIARAWPSLAWAFLPAAWCVWQVTEGFRAASLVWWKPGWVIGRESAVVFLASNFGLWLPLSAVALVQAWRRTDREALLTVGLGLAVFASLFFVMLAPWDWDNTKVMLWCYLVTLPSAFDLVLRPFDSWRRAAAIVLLLLPGAATVVQASLPGRAGNVVADRQELRDVCAALTALPPGERVAVAPTFNHPAALCGQPVAAGYAGHLWSHGVASDERDRNVARLMNGEPGWEDAARALGVHAVYWGPRESREFPSSSRPWESSGRPLASGSWGQLFEVEDRRVPERADP